MRCVQLMAGARYIHPDDKDCGKYVYPDWRDRMDWRKSVEYGEKVWNK
jgi:hypothetical protein